MIFTIRKVYKYTEIVEVEADNEMEALEQSNHLEGDVQNDDYLYDAIVIDAKESVQ